MNKSLLTAEDDDHTSSLLVRYLKVHEGAQEKWRADISKHISQGNENWEKIAPY